jgi:hypothetical protein
MASPDEHTNVPPEPEQPPKPLNILGKEPWFWRWLGPAIPVSAFTLFLLSLLWLLPREYSLVLLLILSPVFFVIFGLAYYVLGSPKGRSKSQISVAAGTVLWAIVTAFLLLLFSLLFGWPLDLRNLINPALIVRKPIEEAFSDKLIELKPRWGTNVFDRPLVNPGMGKAERLKVNMSIWKKWVLDGARPSLETPLVVYESSASTGYYKPLKGRLLFAAGLKVKLLEGVAFQKRIDPSTKEEVFQQLPFYVPETNADPRPGEDPTDNSVEGIVINPGDTLVFVTLFGPLDGVNPPRNLEAYAATLKVE